MFYFKSIKYSIFFLTILFFVSSFIGCLTYETKEYLYKLDKGNAGHGIIRYINLMSSAVNDTANDPESDFQELYDSYYTGDKIEEELGGAKNLKKRLYEEDNRLCGEVSFDFDDITKIKFYKYKVTGNNTNLEESSFWCFYLSAGIGMGMMGNYENYFSSNGTYGGENMPVIFWKGNQNEFKFKTTITSPGKSTTSLLKNWRERNEH